MEWRLRVKLSISRGGSTYYRPGTFSWERNFLYSHFLGVDPLGALFNRPRLCLKCSSSGLRRMLHRQGHECADDLSISVVGGCSAPGG